MLEWTQVRVPSSMYQEVTDLIELNKLWINEHEFIRDAIREKIVKVKTQEVTA